MAESPTSRPTTASSANGGNGGRAIRGLSDRGMAWAFIAPAMSLVFIFNILPLIWTVYLSFTSYEADHPEEALNWVGILNYLEIATDPNAWNALLVTAQFVLVTVVLQGTIGFALAWFIHFRFRSHTFWTVLILLPMLLSPAIVGNVWTYIFDPQTGLPEYAMAYLGGSAQSGSIETGSAEAVLAGAVLADTWMWSPFVMLICLAGFRSIPAELYEAAEIDRATPQRQFWTLTIPHVLPFLALALIFRAIENFRMFDLASALAAFDEREVRMMSHELRARAFDDWQTGQSSAFAVIFIAAIIGLTGIYMRALGRTARG